MLYRWFHFKPPSFTEGGLLFFFQQKCDGLNNFSQIENIIGSIENTVRGFFKLKKLNVIMLALILTVTMSLTAFAEADGTIGAGNTGGTSTPNNTTGNTGVGVTGNGAPANTHTNNMYRTTAVDTDSDWEWIGLLGLAGLFGLRGRNREQNPQK